MLHKEDRHETVVSIGHFASCSDGLRPPSPPPAVAGQAITPVSYASGSSANTTRAFDGTFTGLAVQGVAGGSITPGASTASANCPNYTVASLPPVTISNGLAQFQAIGLTFQGYVTPQGGLMMNSGLAKRSKDKSIAGMSSAVRCSVAAPIT